MTECASIRDFSFTVGRRSNVLFYRNRVQLQFVHCLGLSLTKPNYAILLNKKMEAVWGRKFKDLLFLMKEIKKYSVSLPQGLCVAALFVPGSLPAGNLGGGPLPGSEGQVRRTENGMPLFPPLLWLRLPSTLIFPLASATSLLWQIMFCSPYTYVQRTKSKPRHPNPFHKLHRDDFEKNQGAILFS